MTVLERAGVVSVEALITAAQLCWAGHVSRMSADRLPKQVLYSELLHGKRKRGGQRLRYKDVLKRHLKCAKINTDTWEQVASSRPTWRNALHQVITRVEEKRAAVHLSAHERRHSIPSVSDFTCVNCKRLCRSKGGLAAHLRACRGTPV